MLAFTVLLCYPLKPAVVGHHQITHTHQNKVLLEKSCPINIIFFFFSKYVSKQLFNELRWHVWDDNAEFMSSLRSQGACITVCKLVAIRKLPNIFSQWGRGWRKYLQAAEISRKNTYALGYTSFYSLPVLLVLVKVLFASVLRTITHCSTFAQYWQCFYLMIWQYFFLI